MERGRGGADLADLTPLTALAQPIRRRLYDVVSGAGRPLGRDEAAAAAGVSRSLAAYHLDQLSDQGLLETSFARSGERGGPGAGRPAKLYRRARREFVLRTPPRDYQLLGELLVQAAGDDRTGAVRGTLERTAYSYGRAAGQRAREDGTTGASGLKRLLRLRGYEPVEDDGAVRLRNCPFDAVASNCREVVCGLNLRLVHGILDGLDLAQARAVLEPTAEHCCVAITNAGGSGR